MIRPQDLDAAMHAKPFVPFRIVTTEGETYEIAERDLKTKRVAIGRTYALVGVRTNDADTIFDHYTSVSYEYVDRLEPLPTQAPAL